MFQRSSSGFSQKGSTLRIGGGQWLGLCPHQRTGYLADTNENGRVGRAGHARQCCRISFRRLVVSLSALQEPSPLVVFLCCMETNLNRILVEPWWSARMEREKHARWLVGLRSGISHFAPARLPSCVLPAFTHVFLFPSSSLTAPPWRAKC